MNVVLPTTKGGVAALGLKSLVKLTCVSCKITYPEAIARLSRWLHCETSTLKFWLKEEGLPEHMIKPALNFAELNKVKVFKHQLVPTKAVLSMYDII